ncbi:MAG: hypothetical protein AAGK21_08775 [Bacteroidota bacterium]
MSYFLFPLSSSAQSIVDVLRQQRKEARAAEILAEVGDRLAPRPIVEVAPSDPIVDAYQAVIASRDAVRDSLFQIEEARADSAILAAQLASLRWRKVEPDAQGEFLERFGETYWQAVPPRRDLLADTLDTHGLRGRLQASFGRPTRNADAQRRYGYGGSEYIQFEYWFIVNDSIPVLALDMDGPFGNGLLVASDERYERILPAVKADLSAQLADERPDPWLDYYHAFDRQAWFRTGYNGIEPFTVRVRTPRWSGRVVSDRWIIHR